MWEEAIGVVTMLEQRGYQAYMVGGCVRDLVMSRSINDIDIATSALPEQVAAMFERVIPTGMEHGTVTVLTAGHAYEVTTFRKESAYENFRRPEQVEFIDDLREDLLRRDFTVNAMALDAAGVLHDPFQGQTDVATRRIRCVGDPEARFQEDALRMLRGIRFASILEARIVKSTWRALRTHREKLQHIAMERVRDELWKMTAGPQPVRGWVLLVRSGLLTHTKDSLECLASARVEHWAPLWCALEKVDGADLRFAVLLLGHRVEGPEAKRIMNALRLSNAQQDRLLRILRVQELVAAHEQHKARVACDSRMSHAEIENDTERIDVDKQLMGSQKVAEFALKCMWAGTLFSCGEEALQQWLQCCAALTVSTRPAATLLTPAGSDELKCILLQQGQAWLDDIPVRSLRDLAISGTDILQMTSRPSGSWLKSLLEAAWMAIALKELPNDRIRLLKWIEHRLEEQ
ncbi:CCA tRNA nucleotidyltransferase [Paenibacillus sp. 481]|nr:CCA tRNA nucleotidyltransferase [Paenibacillus sp. 481]